MNYEYACDILDLEINFDSNKLKQKYYRKALKYHPDKNNDINAKKNFQEILDAYEFLKKRDDIKNSYYYEENIIDENKDSYINILQQFMKISGENNLDITRFLSAINNNYSKLSCELLKTMPKSIIIKVNKFINNYSDILYINKDIITELEELIEKYTKNDNNIILTPNINNLLNDEVYKLEMYNDIYYVPLWHHELIYEISNNSLVIQCEPEIPDYITIDQNNNLYVNLTTSVSNILNNKLIEINIGNKIFNIIVSELFINKYQRYIIKNKGIPVINTNNIYDVSCRSNINIDIHLTDIN